MIAVGFSLAALPCASEFEQMINENSKFVSLRELSLSELDGLVAKNLGSSPGISQIHELVAFLRFDGFVIESNRNLASVSAVDIVQSLERNKLASNTMDHVEDRFVEFSEISEDTLERIVFHYFPWQETVNINAVRKLASQFQEYFVVLPFGEGHKSIDTLEIFQALHAIDTRFACMRNNTASRYQRSHSMWNDKKVTERDSERSMSCASIE